MWVGEKQNDTWLLLPRLIGGAVWVSGIAIGLTLTIIMLWVVSLFKQWIDRYLTWISMIIKVRHLKFYLKLISRAIALMRDRKLMPSSRAILIIDTLLIWTIKKIGKKERWERPWLVLLGMAIGFWILAMLMGLGVGVSWVIVIPYLLALGVFIYVFQLSPEEFPRIGPVTPQAWIPMDEVRRLATIAAFFVLAVALYTGLCIVWWSREISSWALSLLLVLASLVLVPIVLAAIWELVRQRGGWTPFVQKLLVLVVFLAGAWDCARWFAWGIRPSWIFPFITPAVSICLLMGVIAVGHASVVYSKNHVKVPLLAYSWYLH